MDELDIPPGGPRAGLASASYRVQRRPGMDPGTKHLLLISGGLGAVLVLIVGYWSMSGQHDGPIPVIQADKAPLRVKPDNPGGMQIAGVGDDLLSGSADSKVQSVAPAPERPDPSALRAQAAPPPVVTPIPAPAAAPPPPVIASLAPPDLPPAPPPKPPVEAAAPKPPAVAATPPPPAPPRPPAVVTPSMLGTSAPPAPAAPLRTEVQLASMVSEQAAHDEWGRLTKRMPELLANRRPEIAKADVNGKVYWRLRTTGFANATQASSFCEQVRAKGGGCSVAAF